MGTPKLAEVIPLQTVHTLDQSRRLMWQWIAHAERFQTLYELAAIQRDMSQMLLDDALREVDRLRKLLA